MVVGLRYPLGRCAKAIEYGLAPEIAVEYEWGSQCREWDQFGTTGADNMKEQEPQVLQSENRSVVGSAGLEPATSTVSR